MGISVRLSQRWGVDYTLQQLKDKGYDAILLATGAPFDETFDIPGCALPRVIPATKFLRDINEGRKIKYGRAAAVFGGNNVAMEVARSLIRTGVNQVTVIYPRAKTEMAANQRNIRMAEREGVQFLLMASPVSFTDRNGSINVELIRMKLDEPDAKGIRNPAAIPGSTVNIQVDSVVVSQGLSACREKFKGGTLEESLELTPKANIKANPRTSLTNIDGVYAAGDVTSGPRSVIQAVVAARRAAENIHAQVMGMEKEPAESRFNFSRGKTFDEVDLRNFVGINVKLREKMPTRPPEICIQDFDEIKLGFSEKMALTEAKRCLQCGCNAFDRCDLKREALEHGVDPIKTGMGTRPVYPYDASHPTIMVDLNKCIYCKRCQNSCEYDALEISARKVNEKGRTEGLSFRFKDNCVSCGKCVDNCSTGALIKKDAIVPVINEESRRVRTTCPYCGAGCQVALKVKGNTILEVSAEPDLAPNYGALCVKGRFAFNFIQHKERLKRPLVRRGGQLVETSWDDALNVVAKRFFDIKALHGADAIAGFSCARATNEENFLMQKFMRTAIGTNNIDHCARL
jgi:formate dehydrogenase major subunit